jgi:hypothetical protein
MLPGEYFLLGTSQLSNVSNGRLTKGLSEAGWLLISLASALLKKQGRSILQATRLSKNNQGIICNRIEDLLLW